MPNYNNNRGNYGNNRNYNGNGNGNRSNNRRQGNDDGKYLNPSSSKKFIHYNEETDPQTGKPPKQRVEFSETETEEISFSLTAVKVQDLIARLEAAANDSEGTGGAYVSLYCKKSKNNRTGEIFDGINILINKQNPPDERFQRGRSSFNSNRGGAGGGRREYPATPNARTSSGTLGGNTPTNNATPTNGGYYAERGTNNVQETARATTTNVYTEPEF